MIVPQNRLLWLVGLTIPPITLACAAIPSAAPLLWAACAAIGGVCLFDAFHAVKCCNELRVDFPERINITRHREETLDLTVLVGNRAVEALLLGLHLPREIASSWKEHRTAIPNGGAELRIKWPIVALRRGEYQIPGCTFRVPSRLGLWSKQKSLPAGTTIRVYPDLAGEHKKLAALFLCRNGSGLHAQRQVGQGHEFEKLRDYLPGDSMSDIHWKATAKHCRLVTKEYQIERTQDIYVVVDASRLSARTTPVPLEHHSGEEGELLLERYIRASLALGAVVQRHGDRFGLITFSNRILSFLRAGGGRVHLQACRDALLDLKTQTVTPDFEELAASILQNLRRRALLLMLTSLDDPALAGSFVRSMEPVSRRHLVVANMVRPALARPLFSDRDVSEQADIYRSLGGHLLWHSLRELEMTLMRYAIGFTLVDHENLCIEMASCYITIKRRQIL